jgi:hypothetical protein
MKEKVVNLLEDAERTIGILMLEINRLNVELNATKLRELTDEEILEFKDKVPYTLGSDLIDFARAILKKAGEK